jgi:hypothetical protein
MELRGQTMGWYKNASVWSVIVASAALVLSQLPPVVNWFPSRKLSVQVASRVGLPNSFGLIGFQILLSIENNGNRTANLSNLALEVVYPNYEKKIVSAQSYWRILPGQNTATDLPITTVAIPAGGGWSEMVSFYADQSPNDEEDTSHARIKISRDLMAKRAKGDGETGRPWAEADPASVGEAVALFDKRFDLKKGEYLVNIKCSINGQETSLKQFRFTLYDHHIETFKAQKEDYKYGFGVNIALDQSKSIWVQLSR